MKTYRGSTAPSFSVHPKCIARSALSKKKGIKGQRAKKSVRFNLFVQFTPSDEALYKRCVARCKRERFNLPCFYNGTRFKSHSCEDLMRGARQPGTLETSSRWQSVTCIAPPSSPTQPNHVHCPGSGCVVPVPCAGCNPQRYALDAILPSCPVSLPAPPPRHKKGILRRPLAYSIRRSVTSCKKRMPTPRWAHSIAPREQARCSSTSPDFDSPDKSVRDSCMRNVSAPEYGSGPNCGAASVSSKIVGREPNSIRRNCHGSSPRPVFIDDLSVSIEGLQISPNTAAFYHESQRERAAMLNAFCDNFRTSEQRHGRFTSGLSAPQSEDALERDDHDNHVEMDAAIYCGKRAGFGGNGSFYNGSSSNSNNGSNSGSNCRFDTNNNSVQKWLQLERGEKSHHSKTSSAAPPAATQPGGPEMRDCPDTHSRPTTSAASGREVTPGKPETRDCPDTHSKPTTSTVSGKELTPTRPETRDRPDTKATTSGASGTESTPGTPETRHFPETHKPTTSTASDRDFTPTLEKGAEGEESIPVITPQTTQNNNSPAANQPNSDDKLTENQLENSSRPVSSVTEDFGSEYHLDDNFELPDDPEEEIDEEFWDLVCRQVSSESFKLRPTDPVSQSGSTSSSPQAMTSTQTGQTSARIDPALGGIGVVKHEDGIDTGGHNSASSDILNTTVNEHCHTSVGTDTAVRSGFQQSSATTPSTNNTLSVGTGETHSQHGQPIKSDIVGLPLPSEVETAREVTQPSKAFDTATDLDTNVESACCTHPPNDHTNQATKSQVNRDEAEKEEKAATDAAVKTDNACSVPMEVETKLETPHGEAGRDHALNLCPVLGCGLQFSLASLLQAHLDQMQHSPCNPLATMLDGTLPTAATNPPRFLCPLCGNVFQEETSCMDHMLEANHARLLSPVPCRVFSCPECLRFFPDPESALRHIEDLSHHGYAFYFPGDAAAPNRARPIPVPCRVMTELLARCHRVCHTLVCQDCGTGISDPGELRSHLDSRHIVASKCCTSVRDVFSDLLTDQACAECGQFIYRGLPPTGLAVHTACPLQGPVITWRARTLREFLLRCGVAEVSVGTELTLDCGGGGGGVQPRCPASPLPPLTSTGLTSDGDIECRAGPRQCVSDTGVRSRTVEAKKEFPDFKSDGRLLGENSPRHDGVEDSKEVLEGPTASCGHRPSVGDSISGDQSRGFSVSLFVRSGVNEGLQGQECVHQLENTESKCVNTNPHNNEVGGASTASKYSSETVSFQGSSGQHLQPLSPCQAGPSISECLSVPTQESWASTSAASGCSTVPLLSSCSTRRQQSGSALRPHSSFLAEDPHGSESHGSCDSDSLYSYDSSSCCGSSSSLLLHHQSRETYCGDEHEMDIDGESERAGPVERTANDVVSLDGHRNMGPSITIPENGSAANATISVSRFVGGSVASSSKETDQDVPANLDKPSGTHLPETKRLESKHKLDVARNKMVFGSGASLDKHFHSPLTSTVARSFREQGTQVEGSDAHFSDPVALTPLATREAWLTREVTRRLTANIIHESATIHVTSLARDGNDDVDGGGIKDESAEEEIDADVLYAACIGKKRHHHQSQRGRTKKMRKTGRNLGHRVRYTAAWAMSPIYRAVEDGSAFHGSSQGTDMAGYPPPLNGCKDMARSKSFHFPDMTSTMGLRREPKTGEPTFISCRQMVTHSQQCSYHENTRKALRRKKKQRKAASKKRTPRRQDNTLKRLETRYVIAATNRSPVRDPSCLDLNAAETNVYRETIGKEQEMCSRDVPSDRCGGVSAPELVESLYMLVDSQRWVPVGENLCTPKEEDTREENISEECFRFGSAQEALAGGSQKQTTFSRGICTSDLFPAAEESRYVILPCKMAANNTLKKGHWPKRALDLDPVESSSSFLKPKGLGGPLPNKAVGSAKPVSFAPAFNDKPKSCAHVIGMKANQSLPTSCRTFTNQSQSTVCDSNHVLSEESRYFILTSAPVTKSVGLPQKPCHDSVDVPKRCPGEGASDSNNKAGVGLSSGLSLSGQMDRTGAGPAAKNFSLVNNTVTPLSHAPECYDYGRDFSVRGGCPFPLRSPFVLPKFFTRWRQQTRRGQGKRVVKQEEASPGLRSVSGKEQVEMTEDCNEDDRFVVVGMPKTVCSTHKEDRDKTELASVDEEMAEMDDGNILYYKETKNDNDKDSCNAADKMNDGTSVYCGDPLEDNGAKFSTLADKHASCSNVNEDTFYALAKPNKTSDNEGISCVKENEIKLESSTFVISQSNVAARFSGGVKDSNTTTRPRTRSSAIHKAVKRPATKSKKNKKKLPRSQAVKNKSKAGKLKMANKRKKRKATKGDSKSRKMLSCKLVLRERRKKQQHQSEKKAIPPITVSNPTTPNVRSNEQEGCPLNRVSMEEKVKLETKSASPESDVTVVPKPQPETCSELHQDLQDDDTRTQTTAASEESQPLPTPSRGKQQTVHTEISPKTSSSNFTPVAKVKTSDPEATCATVEGRPGASSVMPDSGQSSGVSRVTFAAELSSETADKAAPYQPAEARQSSQTTDMAGSSQTAEVGQSVPQPARSMMLRLDGPSSSRGSLLSRPSTTAADCSNEARGCPRHPKLRTPKIQHLSNMTSIVFADLENFMFFKNFRGQLPPLTFVWGFVCARPSAPFHQERYFRKYELYRSLKSKRCAHVSTDIGFGKDAVDFAMTLAIAKLDDRLPATIPFYIVSSDGGFREVENQMRRARREVKVVAPRRHRLTSAGLIM